MLCLGGDSASGRPGRVDSGEGTAQQRRSQWCSRRRQETIAKHKRLVREYRGCSDNNAELEWMVRLVCANSSSVKCFVNSDCDLTRFGKIAIQGTPQMAADMESISLLRVHSYYSNCNQPLL